MRIIKYKKAITLLSSTLIIVILILFIRYKANLPYTKEGNKLIEKIECYKKEYGVYPNSLTDMGIKVTMGEGPYYEKKDKGYIIYFNIGFDNAFIYDSHTKKWEDKP